MSFAPITYKLSICYQLNHTSPLGIPHTESPLLVTYVCVCVYECKIIIIIYKKD